jgi:hypothetical protein
MTVTELIEKLKIIPLDAMVVADRSNNKQQPPTSRNPPAKYIEKGI